MLLAGSTARAADIRTWRVTEGTATFQFYGAGLGDVGIDLQSDCATSDRVALGMRHIVDAVTPDSTLTVGVTASGVHVLEVDLRFAAGLVAMGRGRTDVVNDMRMVTNADWEMHELLVIDNARTPRPALIIPDFDARLNFNTKQLVVTSESVRLSQPWARSLGVAVDADAPIARVMIELSVTGAEPADAGFPSLDELAPTYVDDYGGVAGTTSGPDVSVYGISGTYAYGCGPLVEDPPGSENWVCMRDPETGSYISGFAIGTISCNVGDQNLVWFPDTNQHPVIGQNMYKLKDHRFEHIGQAWIKHGFFATDQNYCGQCSDVDNHVPGTWLAPGCSDLYSSSINGNWIYLGPKSSINANTGYNPGPVPRTSPPNPHTVERRLQVYNDDLYPETNAGAKYFVEGHYVTPDDAAADHDDNNIAYKQVQVLRLGDELFVLSDGGPPAVSEQPAIRAWADADPPVTITNAKVPGEGLFVVGAKSIELTGGFFRYEFAVFNMNSDRAAGSFTVPLPVGASVRNPGFHDVFYHSGEIYDGTDWTVEITEGNITWSTVPYEVDVNANALRWSTLYNFWFEINAPPFQTDVTLGLFKPGAPDSILVATRGPAPFPFDCNHNGTPDNCDVSCDFPTCTDYVCGTSEDCNGNVIPDECDDDCNENGIPDNCDLDWATGVTCDCNGPSGTSEDCNDNLIPDECDPDCDGDGIPNDCEEDSDNDDDGVPDCDDPCPLTTPPGLCNCTPQCCCNGGQICFPGWTPEDCLALGNDCAPVCQVVKCRNGCVIGDSDGDGDVDLFDAGQFAACFSGTSSDGGFVMPSADCLLWMDFDEDGDVDREDYYVDPSQLQHSFHAACSGPGAFHGQ